MRILSLPVLLFTACCGLLAILATGAHAQSARNERIFVVPAPAGVKIDGNLADWDKSGGVETFVTPETRAMISLKTYAMYDAQAYYLGAEVKDPTPMVNIHDPDINPGYAWDADAFQFRMFLNPHFPGVDNAPKDEVVHLLLWYYTNGKEPCLQMSYGMPMTGESRWKNGVVPHEFYQAAYIKDADGHGYSFEYRIPWSTLGDKFHPKAGDLTAATFQNLWGNNDGTHTMGGGGWGYDMMRSAGFPYQSSVCWGKAIFSEKGNLPKALTQEGLEPVPPAPIKFTYNLPKDGLVSIALLDANGSPLRQIAAAAPRSKGQVIEVWDGLDDKGDPLPPGEYKWKGLYHDPLKVEWKLSVHNSGNPGYPTPDGKGSWGADHGMPTCAAAAGNRMALGWEVGECGWAVIATDLDGNKQWGGRWQCLHMAADEKYVYFQGGMADIGIMRARMADGVQEKYGNKEQFCALPTVTSKDGKTRMLGEKGSISGMVLSGDSLMYVACPRLEDTRDEGNRLAIVDRQSGLLHGTLTLTGADQHATLGNIALRNANELYAILGTQVVIVNLADGVCRPFAVTHLDTPTGVAADAAGNLYVSNRGKLQNISVFSTAGKYLRSIGKAGGRPGIGTWNGNGVLNPQEMAVDARGRLWVAEYTNTPKRISVWNTKNSKLVKDFFGGSAYSTYVDMDPNDPTRVYCQGVQWKVNIDKGSWRPEAIFYPEDGGGSYTHVFTGPGGRQYAVTRNVTLLMRKGDRFVPIAGMMPLDTYKAEPWYAQYQKDHPTLTSTVFWSDTNGDGRATPDELSAPTFPTNYWGGNADEQLALYGSSQGNGLAYRLKPQTILPNGVPVYNPAQVEKFGTTGPGYGNSVLGDSAGKAVYFLGGGIYGQKQYPGLCKFNDDGKLSWGYWTVSTDWTDALKRGIAPKGTSWGTTRLMGKAGDYLAALNYFGPIDLYTSDGLFVDKIYQDGRLGKSGADMVNAEFFCGSFVKTKKDGRYFILAGDSDGRVNELLGLDTVQRLDGAYTLAKDDVEKATTERAEYQQQVARAQSLVLHRMNGIDWDLAKPVKKKLDENRQFKAAVAYDDKDLVLRYEVQSPSEMTNAIAEPLTIFKGGNCIDVEIQTDPAADPARKTAGIGDLRLLITRQGGNAVAMGYFKQVQGFTGKAITLQSPTGVETFDKIEPIPVKMDYTPGNGGFTVLVRIPLQAIGLTLQPATTLRLDVGYRFGNVNGSQVGQRVYWSNTSALANIIYDIPSEIRMEPANWGTAVVE